jgi:hypothetical protein
MPVCSVSPSIILFGAVPTIFEVAKIKQAATTFRIVSRDGLFMRSSPHCELDVNDGGRSTDGTSWSPHHASIRRMLDEGEVNLIVVFCYITSLCVTFGSTTYEEAATCTSGQYVVSGPYVRAHNLPLPAPSCMAGLTTEVRHG